MLSPRKIGILRDNWTFIFDPHQNLNTYSFYSNPTESSSSDRAYFGI